MRPRLSTYAPTSLAYLVCTLLVHIFHVQICIHLWGTCMNMCSLPSFILRCWNSIVACPRLGGMAKIWWNYRSTKSAFLWPVFIATLRGNMLLVPNLHLSLCLSTNVAGLKSAQPLKDPVGLLTCFTQIYFKDESCLCWSMSFSTRNLASCWAFFGKTAPVRKSGTEVGCQMSEVGYNFIR